MKSNGAGDPRSGFGKIFVLDVGSVTVLCVGCVGDGLDASIRKVNAVRAGGHLSVATLRMGVFLERRFVKNRPGETVRLASLNNNVEKFIREIVLGNLNVQF